ncbi:MAG: fluoride efflux transporter CrcB [Xanthomonadales bacterium]|nr:fluoride efflux transporter CrcB [Xanthomonadales bacterium]
MNLWWQQILVVGVGGALGSIGRFLTSEWMTKLAGRGFPWGTLTVNLLGSLLAGLLFAWLAGREGAAAWLRMLLMVGVLGGFTTWSSFALETLLLGRGSGVGLAGAYVLSSLLGGLVLVWFGFRLGMGLRG